MCLSCVECSFGMHAGRFMGFMLTPKGIEAENPEKCQDIIDIRS